MPIVRTNEAAQDLEFGLPPKIKFLKIKSPKDEVAQDEEMEPVLPVVNDQEGVPGSHAPKISSSEVGDALMIEA